MRVGEGGEVSTGLEIDVREADLPSSVAGRALEAIRPADSWEPRFGSIEIDTEFLENGRETHLFAALAHELGHVLGAWKGGTETESYAPFTDTEAGTWTGANVVAVYGGPAPFQDESDPKTWVDGKRDPLASEFDFAHSGVCVSLLAYCRRNAAQPAFLPHAIDFAFLADLGMTVTEETLRPETHGLAGWTDHAAFTLAVSRELRLALAEPQPYYDGAANYPQTLDVVDLLRVGVDVFGHRSTGAILQSHAADGLGRDRPLRRGFDRRCNRPRRTAACHRRRQLGARPRHPGRQGELHLARRPRGRDIRSLRRRTPLLPVRAVGQRNHGNRRRFDASRGLLRSGARGSCGGAARPDGRAFGELRGYGGRPVYPRGSGSRRPTIWLEGSTSGDRLTRPTTDGISTGARETPAASFAMDHRAAGPLGRRQPATACFQPPPDGICESGARLDSDRDFARIERQTSAATDGGRGRHVIDGYTGTLEHAAFAAGFEKYTDGWTGADGTGGFYRNWAGVQGTLAGRAPDSVARWSGPMFGYGGGHAANEAAIVEGLATVAYSLRDNQVSLGFSEVVSRDGRRQLDDFGFEDLALGSDGTFAGGSGGTVHGALFGASHEEAAGAFHHNSARVTGSFGARRMPDTVTLHESGCGQGRGKLAHVR